VSPVSRTLPTSWVRTAALLLSAALAGRSALACDSATCSLLTRSSTGLVPAKRLKVDLTFGYTDQGIRLEGSEPVDVVYRPRVLLERGTIIPGFHQDLDGSDRIFQLDLTYGLSSRLNLTASVPLSVRHTHDVAHGDLVAEYGTTGFGDVLAGLRWAMGPRRLVGGFAVKTPTGPYTIGGEFGGGIQDPTLQPGTGAFDFVGSLQYSWSAESLRLTWAVAASYQLTTPNRFDYRFANQAIATAGVSRPLSGRLSLSLQAKLFHQDRNRFVGEPVPSTGGTFVYLTPGLRLDAARDFSLYSYVLFVPYRYVYDAQLAPRYSVLAGVSRTFH
jgi:hypothetical protein